MNAPLPNARHERFAQVMAACGNASEAWRQATGKSHNADKWGYVWGVKRGMRERIAGMPRLQPVTVCGLALGGLPQIFRHQFVLGGEVAV